MQKKDELIKLIITLLILFNLSFLTTQFTGDSAPKGSFYLEQYLDALVFNQDTDKYLTVDCSDEKIKSCGVYDYEIMHYDSWKVKVAGRKIRKGMGSVWVLSREEDGTQEYRLYKIRVVDEKISKIE